MKQSEEQLQAVEELLAIRYKVHKTTECPELELVALTLEGQASPEEAEAAAHHLQQCHDCALSVLMLQNARSEPVIKINWPQKLTHNTVGRIAAAAMVLIIAGALIIWGFNQKKVENNIFQSSLFDDFSRLKIKGNGDHIQIGVERGADRFRLAKGGKLIKGDRLGLFYSTDQPGFLAVFSLNENKEIFLLYPAGERESKEIKRGNETSLSAGGVATDGSGCEWIVGFFSDTPLSVENMRGALRRTELERQGCELKVRAEGTRTVRVFPIKR